VDVVLVLQRLAAAAATAVTTPARTIQPLDWVPDSIEPPCVYPESVRIEWDQTMGRGLDKLVVNLRLLCSRADDREGQHMLYGLLAGSGAGSMKAAIEAARGAPGALALSGAAHDLHVASTGEARWYEVAGEKLVGTDFEVTIYGSGS
jgi:hypothetical protein